MISAQPMTSPLGIIEVRRYTTHPGKRDALLELFDREFLETQETHGMLAIGHYRDLDDADSFVWFRGFPARGGRRAALEAFYTSHAWLAHREAANATMVDSDNVLMLRPARTHSGFDLSGLSRPPSGVPRTGAESTVAVSVLMLDRAADEDFIGTFETAVLPELQRRAQRIAYLVTEDTPNDFPRLPVREGEHAFVVAGICPNAEARNTWLRVFDRQPLPDRMHARTLIRETLCLSPAPRALFR